MMCLKRLLQPVTFLKKLKSILSKNDKAETSTLLSNLISMKFKGKTSIRKYILEMSNITLKVKALKLVLSEDLLMNLVLISPPA